MASSNQHITISDAFQNLPEEADSLLRSAENPFLNLAWFDVFAAMVAPQLGTDRWYTPSEYAIEARGVKIVDYLTGDDSYKRSRMNDVRSLQRFANCAHDALARCNHRSKRQARPVAAVVEGGRARP